MAYFLKKAKRNNRVYLSICNSFYNHNKKGTAHKTYQSLGSMDTLIKQGIEDPIAYYQKEVDKLNEKKKQEGVRKITSKSPLLQLGYFPLMNILEKLGVKRYIDYFKLTNDFTFDLYELLSTLIYARCVNPCSKYRTFHEVLPKGTSKNSEHKSFSTRNGLFFLKKPRFTSSKATFFSKKTARS